MRIDHKRQKGWALLEVLMAIILIALALPIVYSMIDRGLTGQIQKLTASQLAGIGEAVNAYVKANYNTLKTNATPTTPAEIMFSDLLADGYLPPGASDRNPWNQRYRIFVHEPEPDNLRTVILSYGGKNGSQEPEFASRVVPATALRVGAAGGFVPTGNVPGENPNQLRGAAGGWVMPINAGIPNPGPGHLGMLLYFEDGQLGEDYLYRFAVPGQPELNTMYTNLNMDDNDVEDVRDLHVNGQIGTNGLDPNTGYPSGITRGIRTRGLHAEDDISAGTLAGNQPAVHIEAQGDVSLNRQNIKLSTMPQIRSQAESGDYVRKPTCLPGQDAKIRLSVMNAAANETGLPMSAIRTYSQDYSGAYWRVYMRILTQAGWVTATAPYGTMNVTTWCE